MPNTKETLITCPADMAWLYRTHLVGEKRVRGSAVLIGNEDCPERILVYAYAYPDCADTYTEYLLVGDKYIKQAQED